MSHVTSQSCTRRGFLMGAAGLGALAGLTATGCAPRTAAQEDPREALAATGAGASADWLGEAPEIAESEIVDTKDTEFLVVGAGNAGLVAAVSAYELGLDFLLAEKNDFYMTPRNFIGAIDTAQSKEAGIVYDRNAIMNELARYASFKCNMDLIKVWMDESGELFDWLAPYMERGGKTPMFQGPVFEDPYNSGEGGGRYYVPPIQHQHVGADFNAYAGVERNEILAGFLEENGNAPLYGHELVKLIREDDNTGRVSAGIFKTADGYVRINASKGILLATGGYAANPDMLEALQPLTVKTVTTNGYMTQNDGSGIKAAMWVGAAKQTEGTAMVFNRGGVEPGVPAGYQLDAAGNRVFPGTFSQVKLGSQPFLKVNREGRRFVNESCPYDFVNHAASCQTDGVWCQIFDANAKADIERFDTKGCSSIKNTFVKTDLTIDEFIADWAAAGVYWKADTLEELAEMLQLPYDELQKTVDRYNELFDKQVDEDYGKEAKRLSAIREAPFYGGWFGGNLLTTLDGLHINTDMQVLDASNQVIEGLYAAGDCSGDFFCNNYPEYIIGVAVGRTMTFGRHVARLLAGDL
ncbi:MAG: FAD-binding protein [Adlercreutzia sp.]|nr:FAD-binding protein [Adlercreutzia sp.]